jgi:glycosyltransferase involved in cell wall biosynthesis
VVRDNKLHVLVVGQTPPPVHGQALMIDQLVRGKFERVELHHVRMDFSRDILDVGRFRLGKLGHLLSVVTRIILAKARHRPTVLYYPPAGPDVIPVLRDVFILLSTRPLFPHTVFHFHAGGVGEFVSKLPMPLRFLSRRAYAAPDCAIVLSEDNYGDGERLGARHMVVVPNGIGEHQSLERSKKRPANGVPRMLYVGVLGEAKGIAVLLEACRKLRDGGVSFELDLVGQFESVSFEKTIRGFVQENRLGDRVHFHGVQVGDAKWDIYKQADLFCFPSFHETFGLVLLEAMQFALPIVASNYPGVDRLVHDGTTGYTVSPNDADALSKRIGRLLTDAKQCRQMGAKGRVLYEKEYTLPIWYERMEQALLTVSRPVD